MSTQGITGTDGKVAVYDPDGLWHWWNMNEVYTGGPGLNRYVPKVGDYIEDTSPVRSVTYVVTELNMSTLIPTFVKKRRECECDDESTLNQLIGPGSDTYRVYLDTSVTPHILAVDARLTVGGTLSDHARIYRGTNIGPDGKLISFLFDNSGNFLTNNVPLELAAIDSHVNHSIKVVSVCNTLETMIDGEICTVVIYDDNGHVVCTRQLLVRNTSFIRGVNAAQRYISAISLKSPFLSTSDDHRLEFPINTPIDSSNMIGRIHYSDGGITEMPVDGNKFKIMGMENFISTVPGMTFPLSLCYTLSNGEITYTATSGEGKYITEPYDMITTEQIGALNVKLVAYPVWVDNATGYVLRWFLYNLDRTASFEVTSMVQYNTDSDVYNGKAYGVNQKLSVRINLKNVNNAFISYIHVQTLDITLNHEGFERTTNWTVGFVPGQAPRYGNNLKARVAMITANSYRVRLASEFLTLSDWLQNLFYNSKPIINPSRELTAPEPNFFAIVVGSSRYEYPVSAWNSELTIGQSFDINGTMFIEFFRREPGNDIILGMSAMPVYEM